MRWRYMLLGLAPSFALGCAPGADESPARGFQSESVNHRVTIHHDGEIRFEPFGRIRSGETKNGKPIVLRTNRIAGNVAEADDIIVTNDRQLQIKRGSTIEKLDLNDDGIEQSWIFPTRPAAGQSIEVRVGVAAGALAAQTDSGLHFIDPDTGLGARYGVATFVDAAGVRTTVASRFEAGEIVMTVPSEVVATAAFPAVLDPTLSSEFGIDSPAQAGDEHGPSAAFDGTHYLVAWNELTADGKHSIRGRFVSASGQPEGDSSFLIMPAVQPLREVDASPGSPEVVWDGSSFVVFHTYFPDGVNMATVTSSGDVAGPYSVSGDGGACFDTRVRAAANSTGQIVVVCSRVNTLPTDTSIPGYSTAVAMVIPRDRLVTVDYIPELHPFTYVRTLDTISLGGHVVCQQPLSCNDWRPGVASDGTGFVASWARTDGTSLIGDDRALYALAIRADETSVTEGSATKIATIAAPDMQAGVAYGGGRYVATAVYPGMAGIAGISLSVSGTTISVLGGGNLPIGTPSMNTPIGSAVIWDGTEFLAATGESATGGVGAWTSDLRQVGNAAYIGKDYNDTFALATAGNGSSLVTYAVSGIVKARLSTTADRDMDGVDAATDNCPTVANPLQTNTDGDASGDACDVCPADPADDADADGICGNLDNCPNTANPSQIDNDGDGSGDACDNDDDNDGVADTSDNCPLAANPTQADRDGDGAGDVCDLDADGDGVVDGDDACLNTAPLATHDASGCSVADLVPCTLVPPAAWKNHGAYVSAITQVAQTFFSKGLISAAQRDDLASAAANSTCGK